MCAQLVGQQQHPLLAVKNAKVSDFGGRTLSTVSSSVVTVDPDLPEAGQLRHWCAQACAASVGAVAPSLTCVA